MNQAGERCRHGTSDGESPKPPSPHINTAGLRESRKDSARRVKIAIQYHTSIQSRQFSIRTHIIQAPTPFPPYFPPPRTSLLPPTLPPSLSHLRAKNKNMLHVLKRRSHPPATPIRIAQQARSTSSYHSSSAAPTWRGPLGVPGPSPPPPLQAWVPTPMVTETVVGENALFLNGGLKAFLKLCFSLATPFLGHFRRCGKENGFFLCGEKGVSF